MTVLNVCSPLQFDFQCLKKESFGEKPIKRKIFIQSQRKKICLSFYFCWQCFFKKKNQKREKNMRWGRGVGNSFLIQAKKKLLGAALQFYQRCNLADNAKIILPFSSKIDNEQYIIVGQVVSIYLSKFIIIMYTFFV